MVRPAVNLQGFGVVLSAHFSIDIVLEYKTDWHGLTRRSEILYQSCNLIYHVQQTIQILLVDTAFSISFPFHFYCIPFPSSGSWCCGCLQYVLLNLVMQYCMVMGIIWSRYLYCRMHTSPMLRICSCWHSSLLNVRTLEIPHCTQKLRLKLLYRTASLLNSVWCTHFGISLLHYMHYIPSVHMCTFAHMCIICIKWGVHTCIGHALAQLY